MSHQTFPTTTARFLHSLNEAKTRTLNEIKHDDKMTIAGRVTFFSSLFPLCMVLNYYKLVMVTGNMYKRITRFNIDGIKVGAFLIF